MSDDREKDMSGEENRSHSGKEAGSSDSRGNTSHGTGERRYGRPAGAGTGAHGSSDSRGNASHGTGERRYGRPAGAGAAAHGSSDSRGNASHGTGERRYGRPAGAGAAAHGNGETRGNATHGTGERRYGRPAGSGAGAHGNGETRGNATHGTGERRYGRPAGAGAAAHGSGDSRGNASHGTGERRYGRPAGAGTAAFRSSGNQGSRRPNSGYGRPTPRRDAAPEETTGLSMGARRLALDVLCDVHQNGAYASLSLNEHLSKSKIKPEDRRLVTGIVYGTLENEIRIDYVLDKLMDHPTHEAVQRDILRLSAFQILFLDRIPDSAAVNEAVKLVKAMDMESASGFINAVLRNLVRGKDEIIWPKKEDDLRTYLHIMTSTPLWLVDKLVESYGAEEAEQLLSYRTTDHPLVVRPNMTRLTDQQFEELLQKKNQPFIKGIAPHAYLLHNVTEPGFDPDYQSGLYSIQGQSSMLAAEAIQAKPGMKILDACAAPGGKSAYLCEAMQMTGRVFAWELHEKRAMLLEGARRRLKLENLRVSVRDAAEFREDQAGTMDAVLLDAPCSGTGVMLQKPDIKLRLKEEDIPAIAETQKKLLNTLCRYVKPGGTFVYSTCSVLPEENMEQIKAFLEEHPEYTVQPLPTSFPEELRRQQTAYGLQLLGYRDNVEGFFIVRMRRSR